MFSLVILEDEVYFQFEIEYLAFGQLNQEYTYTYYTNASMHAAAIE